MKRRQKQQPGTAPATTTQPSIETTAAEVNAPTASRKPELMSLETYKRLESELAECVYQEFIGRGLYLENARSRCLWMERSYKSWNVFCEQEAGISGRLADRLIAAVQIALAIKQGKAVGSIVPLCEDQVLPLMRVNEQDRWRELWDLAVERTGGEQPSIAMVKRVVGEYLEREKKLNPPPPAVPKQTRKERLAEVCASLKKALEEKDRDGMERACADLGKCI